jgi:hypothetical protein
MHSRSPLQTKLLFATQIIVFSLVNLMEQVNIAAGQNAEASHVKAARSYNNHCLKLH